MRSVLSPGLAASVVPDGGRLIEVAWSGPLGSVVVDRDVRLPDTNKHPGVAIEEFVFSSLPLDES